MVKGDGMKETRNGTKAIRVMGNQVFYGQYYNNGRGGEDFQVLEAKDYTERKLANMKKKYGF